MIRSPSWVVLYVVAGLLLIASIYWQGRLAGVASERPKTDAAIAERDASRTNEAALRATISQQNAAVATVAADGTGRREDAHRAAQNYDAAPPAPAASIEPPASADTDAAEAIAVGRAAWSELL